MKKARYAPEQIAFAARRAESGTPISEVAPSQASPSRPSRKCRFSGMGVAEVRRLKLLEEENCGLRCPRN
jgi:putative transposase